MSPARSPRTPRLAETLFEAACQAAGLTANRSQDDQFGWDFLLQFPAERRGGPADLDAPGATCLVQVKSTRSGRLSIRLKLSNALRFAKEPIPCFLVLLDFQAGATSPSAAYVRHVWTDEISQALKAAREAHVEDDKALHRRGLTIRFQEDDRCEFDVVTARIEAIIAAAGADYGTAKTAFAASVGYEDGVATGTFTFQEGVDGEAFVDLMLGRIADLPVSSISMREGRFGLPGPELVTEGPARLSVEAVPHEACQLVVGPADGSDELTLDGELYVPGVPSLSEDLFRIRVQTKLLEFIVRFKGESKLNVHYDGDAKEDITTIAEQAKLWNWLNAGPLKVALWVRGTLCSYGVVDLTGTFAPLAWGRLAKALSRLLEFMPARRWPPEARFTLRDLFAGLDELETFAAQVCGAGVTMTLGPLKPEFAQIMGGLRRHLGPASLDLGDATLLAVVEAPIERIAPDGMNWAIKLGTPRSHARAVLAGGALANRGFLQKQLAEVRADHGQGGDVLISTFQDEDVPGLA